MPTGRMPQTTCPNCRARLDGVGALEDDVRPPAEGDATVCLYCVEILVFDAQLQLRLPTKAERAELEADPETQRTRAVILKAHLRHGAPPPPPRDDEEGG